VVVLLCCCCCHMPSPAPSYCGSGAPSCSLLPTLGRLQPLRRLLLLRRQCRSRDHGGDVAACESAATHARTHARTRRLTCPLLPDVNMATRTAWLGRVTGLRRNGPCLVDVLVSLTNGRFCEIIEQSDDQLPVQAPASLCQQM
jgi:hypothetical protein